MVSCLNDNYQDAQCSIRRQHHHNNLSYLLIFSLFLALKETRCLKLLAQFTCKTLHFCFVLFCFALFMFCFVLFCFVLFCCCFGILIIYSDGTSSMGGGVRGKRHFRGPKVKNWALELKVYYFCHFFLKLSFFGGGGRANSGKKVFWGKCPHVPCGVTTDHLELDRT